MKRTSFILLLLSMVSSNLLIQAADHPEKDWPAVLVIDDFEAGLDKWENQDTGKLELVDDAPQGKHALRWTASDDGLGHIVLKALDRADIDFSQYQLLSFRIKMEGKKAWNVNPIIQQYPAVYGYRGLYYSVDTLEPFGEWFTYTQDLRRWENAWPDTFSNEAQEFQFEIAQLAGSASTVLYLDDIKLLKNPLGLEPSYPGQHGVLSDGTQVTHFHIRLSNSGDAPITARAALRPGCLSLFTAELPPPVHLLPGETAEALVRLSATKEALARQPDWYGETATVGFTLEESPELTLFTELTAGSLPATATHPCILADSSRVKDWRKQWNDPALRGSMDKAFSNFVKQADAALVRRHTYPELAHTGITTCPKDGTKLQQVDVPTAPFATYQCSTCGIAYSGPMFDAGMQNYLGQHMTNASDVQNLGFAYAITGRLEFANAAADILRRYAEVYPKLPIMAISAGSPVYSHTSGATRIGGTFMRERTWLRALAIGLDFIQPAHALSQDELDAIVNNVLVPSGHLMMDHKVGAMNLQWMIASAGLYAGLAGDHPNLVARAMYDPHGVRNLMAVGYLKDGNWWENPSYQNVAAGVAFPVMATCLHNGILEWTPALKNILTAQFRTYGPDGKGPTLGTGGPGGWNYSVNALYSLGSFLKDPELAWVPYHLPMWRATSGRGMPYESYLWALTWQSTPPIPEDQTTSPIPTGTTNLDDYGGLAMRLPESNSYCYFYYGRELVHGHRSKLSVNAFAKGNWFIRNTSGGYGDDFKTFLETIASSNTIMVDGRNPDWDTGELLFHESAPGIEMASGREVGAWKDVEHERSVVLTNGPLIIVDRVVADATHRYDWLYHSSVTKLDLVRDGLAERQEPLGDTPLYGSLNPDRAFGTPTSARFERKDGSGLQIAFLPVGELFSFKALARKQIPGLLWRQKGDTLGFAAALWPHAAKEAGQVTIERLPVKRADGSVATLVDGQAVKVTAPEGVFTVLINYSGEELSCGTLSGVKRVAVAVSQE